MLILLLVFCPTYSQVIKLTKGEPFPFDTGAGLEISLYRDLRYKSNQCDTFIVKSEKTLLAKDEIIKTQEDSIEKQAKYIKKNKFLAKKSPYLIILAFIIGLII